MQPLASRIPGHATIDDFLTAVSEIVARQPWLRTFGAVLHDVTLVPGEEAWLVCDRERNAIPLARCDHWRLLAITAGLPFDLTGEWDGYGLRPLGLCTNGSFRVV